MSYAKIATCCYCGTRAALTLRGKERHELACSACGAPLHELKMLRSDHTGQRELVSRARKAPREMVLKRKPKRRRKSLKERLLDEVFDAIEDILD